MTIEGSFAPIRRRGPTVRAVLWRQLGRPANRDALILGGALFVAAVVFTLKSAETYDDPWILYRYATNLASGGGWSFNPGMSEGNAVTSPLMVLLLAAQIKIGIPLAIASAAVFLTGTWAAAYFTFLTFRSVQRRFGGVIASALVVSSPWLASLRGMESALLLGAMAVGLWAATTQRRYTTGLSLAVAVLARPDAVVFAGCVLVWIALRARSLPLKEAGAFALAVLPWFAFSQIALHSVLPSTLAAKQAQRNSGEWPGLAVSWLITTATQGRLGILLIVALLAVFGLFAMAATEVRPLLPLTVASALTFLAYELVLHVAGYPWYAATLVFTALLLIAEGLNFAVERWPQTRATAVASALALVILAMLTQNQMSPARHDYATVARWLRAKAKPNSTVAASEIGRLGYLSNLRMVDYLGLLDPRAIPHVQHRDWAWWVTADRPDYWVTEADHSWDEVTEPLQSKPFERHYRLVFRTSELEVYMRHPVGSRGPRR